MEVKDSDDRSLKGLIERIRVELTEYVETRLKLFRVEACEKIGIAGSYIVYGLLVAFVSLLLTIFGLFTLIALIAWLTKSLITGFLIVTALIVLMLLLLLLNAKSVRLKITNSILSIISDIEKDE